MFVPSLIKEGLHIPKTDLLKSRGTRGGHLPELKAYVHARSLAASFHLSAAAV
jgi:hypothetical protein